MAFLVPPDNTPQTPEEKAEVQRRTKWVELEWGYGHLQGTKPQTLAYGLTDSPVGLAAWILEKFYTWSDLQGKDIEHIYTKDELLTNICIYWFTNTINSSVHYYLEMRRNPAKNFSGQYISVPCGFAVFKHELAKYPKSWLARSCNVVHYSEFDFGGHFAALETPKALADDITKFFRPLRQITSKL